MNMTTRTRWLQGIFYILMILLLVEWLYPVLELTKTGYLSIFLVFTVLSFVFSYFGVVWWVVGPAKVFYIAWMIIIVYTNEAFFTKDAILFLFEDAVTNSKALMSRDWTTVTDSFRTVLFFALIWMVAYLIHYWITERLNVFLFFFITVIFIGLLDTFSSYKGDGAIIRLMILGLLLLGLLKAAQIVEHHQISVNRMTYVSLVTPLIMMIAISGGVGYFLPKAGPVWEDPVPYIQSFAEGTASDATIVIGGGAKKIGYGEDDSSLGGAFRSDSTVVFQVVVKTPQYWKIETKDTYTSEGWEQSNSSFDMQNYTVGDPLNTGIPPGPIEKQDSAQLSFELDYPFLMYPYGTIAADAKEGTTFSISPNTQKIDTFLDNETVSLEQYKISFSEPVYSLTALRETSVDSLASLSSEYDRYLQLPEELPERIRQLSRAITEEETNLYEKTRAIERYFARNGFIYDQKNVGVPKEKQDYVDQFLFDTKRGYCDNFSTSMVVMLRAIGIPARWVKGFAEGEEMSNDLGEKTFQVTNNNAHSWVEAYFPGIGWMPFEPTIGFSGTGNVDFDVDLDLNEQPLEPLAPVKPKKTKKLDTENNKTIFEGLTKLIRTSMDWIVNNLGKIILWSLVGGAVALFVYRIRLKWMPKLLVPYHRLRGDDWKTFEKKYFRLIKQLKLYGIERRNGQTLQSYANNVDEFFGSKDMKRLTTAYEKGVYGGNKGEHDWFELRESWENLINRTSG